MKFGPEIIGFNLYLLFSTDGSKQLWTDHPHIPIICMRLCCAGFGVLIGREIDRLTEASQILIKVGEESVSNCRANECWEASQFSHSQKTSPLIGKSCQSISALQITAYHKRRWVYHFLSKAKRLESRHLNGLHVVTAFVLRVDVGR